MTEKKGKAEQHIDTEKTVSADGYAKAIQVKPDEPKKASKGISLSGMIEGSERLEMIVKKDQKIIEIYFPKDENYKDWDLKTLSGEIVRTYKSTYRRFTVQFIFSSRTLITII